MSSDRESLLDAIAANRDEDTPRLVYADWLDENARTEPDRARAEFIRLSVRLERMGPDDPGRTPVRSRVAELTRKYAARWFGRFLQEGPYAVQGQLLGVRLKGGLADSIGLGDPDGDWAKPAARLVADEPVTHLTASLGSSQPFPGLVLALESWPRLRRVRSLSLWAGLPPEEVERLGDNPHLTGVRHLHLTLPPASVRALADRPLAGRIARVSFRLPPEVRYDARARDLVLAYAELFNRSSAEELTFGNLPDDEAVHFLSRVTSPRITTLDANELGFHDPVLAALGQRPFVAQLRALDLRANYFSAPAVGEFLRRAGLDRLTALRASFCFTTGRERGGEVWAAIRDAPFADRLTVLDVGWRPGLTADDLKPFAAGRFPRVESLSIGPARIGDVGVERLAGSPCAAVLRELSLWDCELTDRGAAVLAANFPALARLDVRNNTLSGVARQALARRFGPGLRA